MAVIHRGKRSFVDQLLLHLLLNKKQKFRKLIWGWRENYFFSFILLFFFGALRISNCFWSIQNIILFFWVYNHNVHTGFWLIFFCGWICIMLILSALDYNESSVFFAKFNQICLNPYWTHLLFFQRICFILDIYSFKYVLPHCFVCHVSKEKLKANE